MPAPSSNLPGRLWPGRPPSLFGLAPNGVCRACRVAAASGGLLPHRFTLTPHPNPHAGRRIFSGTPAGLGAGRFAFCGAFRGSPLLGVTQRPALWSPDFPLRAQWPAATVCPTPALFTACQRFLSRIHQAADKACRFYSAWHRNCVWPAYAGFSEKDMSRRVMASGRGAGVNQQEQSLWALLQAC